MPVKRWKPSWASYTSPGMEFVFFVNWMEDVSLLCFQELLQTICRIFFWGVLMILEMYIYYYYVLLLILLLDSVIIMIMSRVLLLWCLVLWLDIIHGLFSGFLPSRQFLNVFDPLVPAWWTKPHPEREEKNLETSSPWGWRDCKSACLTRQVGILIA